MCSIYLRFQVLKVSSLKCLIRIFHEYFVNALAGLNLACHKKPFLCQATHYFHDINMIKMLENNFKWRYCQILCASDVLWFKQLLVQDCFLSCFWRKMTIERIHPLLSINLACLKRTVSDAMIDWKNRHKQRKSSSYSVKQKLLDLFVIFSQGTQLVCFISCFCTQDDPTL